MPVALQIGAPGPIANFSDLKTKLLAYLDRDDVTSSLPLFIGMCESRLNRLLRTPEMEANQLFTTTSDTIALPSNFLQARTVSMPGSPNRALKAMAPSAMPLEYDGSADTPRAYSINGLQMKLVPPPSGSVVVSLDYYTRIPALSDNIPTNWLLLKAPDLYLYGALVQAEAFIDNPAQLQTYKSAFDEAISEMVSAARRERWGSSPLVPNGVTQVFGARC